MMTHPSATYPDGSRCYSIIPTFKCNMDCAYCCPQNHIDRYTLEELIVATDQIFKDFRGKIVYEIFGGEPLLEYETVFSLLRYVMQNYDDRVVHYDIYTNATILNETILNFLHEHKSRIRLCLSLDGTEEGNSTRFFANGASSYALVCTNLRAILAAGLTNRIQYTTHAKNVSYISPGVENLYNMGFRNIRVGIICGTIGVAKPAQRELMPDASYFEVFKAEMRRLYAFADEHPDLYLRNFTESWETINRGPFKFEVTPGELEVDEVCYAINAHVEKISREVYNERQEYLTSKEKSLEA